MNRNEMHRKAIESRYDAVCNIYEYIKVKDEETKLIKSKEVLTGENISCRLSFSSVAATSDDGVTVEKQQAVKLFLAPEVSVKAGSKLVVTQNGVTQAYKNSGVAAIYPSHQEIPLKLFERWT